MGYLSNFRELGPILCPPSLPCGRPQNWIWNRSDKYERTRNIQRIQQVFIHSTFGEIFRSEMNQPSGVIFQRTKLGPGRGTPIYFLGRDVPTVRVSFSGSSVLNRVYIFRFSCLEQGRPRKSSPFLPLQSHNFRWFRAPSLKCVKT